MPVPVCLMLFNNSVNAVYVLIIFLTLQQPDSYDAFQDILHSVILIEMMMQLESPFFVIHAQTIF